jgi:hypothetical protein
MEDTWILLFLIRVWKMRKHQIAWFRHHRPSDLISAKQHEADVDMELMKRLIIIGGEPKELNVPKERQTNLFTEAGNEDT